VAATVTGTPPVAHQRERIVAGVSRAIAEHGSIDVPLERLVLFAGVSREHFELEFETREQAILAAQDEFLERLWLEVASAAEDGGDGVDRLRAGLSAGLACIADNRGLARVFMLEAASAGLAVSERQFAALDRFAALLRSGREGCAGAGQLPASTERVLVGGVASIVAHQLLAEDAHALEELEPQLTRFILIFYLDRDEAERLVDRGTGLG
jgi:TetR/AcrR family transcriptional regulator